MYCCPAPFGLIIGEVGVSNCPSRLAGRIFVSRAIRAASIRTVRCDQRASLMHQSTHSVVLSTSANILNLTAKDYQTKLTFLAKTNPPAACRLQVRPHTQAQSQGS